MAVVKSPKNIGRKKNWIKHHSKRITLTKVLFAPSYYNTVFFKSFIKSIYVLIENLSNLNNPKKLNRLFIHQIKVLLFY